jgi:hypothetical protein
MLYECTPDGHKRFTIDLDKVAYVAWEKVAGTDDRFSAIVHFDGGAAPLVMGEMMPGHAAQFKKALSDHKSK